MKKFFFPILMSAMLVYGGKVSAQTDKDHPKSVKPLPAGHKPAVAPVTVKPLPPAPIAARPVPVQARPSTASPAPITAKPIPVAPRPLPSSAKPVPVASKPAPVQTRPVPVATKPTPVAPRPVAKVTTPAPIAPAAKTTKSKAKKATAAKTRKPKASKNVEIVRNEPVYTPAPSYSNREPERLNIQQTHEGPTVVEIKDQKIKVNDETVARLNSINDCIRINIDHKSEINLVREKKECVKVDPCCAHRKAFCRYCHMKHCSRMHDDCKHECKSECSRDERRDIPARPTRPCRYNY
jgi:hypothetical protein